MLRKKQQIAVLVLGLALLAGLWLIYFHGSSSNESTDANGPDASAINVVLENPDVGRSEALHDENESRRTASHFAVVPQSSDLSVEPVPVEGKGPIEEKGPIEGRWLIAGRIVQARDHLGQGDVGPNQAVEGVRIHLKNHPRRNLPGVAFPVRSQITGPDGRFAFGGVPGDHWFYIEIDEASHAYRTLSFHRDSSEGEGQIDVGDVLLEPGRDIVIDILGSDGKPVENADVWVGRVKGQRAESLSNASIHESRRRARELGRGKYAIERVPAGTLRIAAQAAGCARFHEHVTVPANGVVKIRLEAGLEIAGRVLNPDDDPVAGAKLDVEGPNVGEPLPTTRTDDTGRFVFDILSPGVYAVTVTAEGYASARADRITAGMEDLRFRLVPEAAYSGKVVTIDEQAVIAGAKIILRHRDSEETFSTVSDAGGAFGLHRLRPGIYSVRVDHEGFAPKTNITLEMDEGTRLANQTIRLNPGFTIRGSVIEAATKRPIPHAILKFAMVDERSGIRMVRSTKSASDGSYVLGGVIDKSCLLSVSAAGFVAKVDQSVSFEVGGKSNFTVSLERGASIAGRVRDVLGRPLTGATLDLRMSHSSGRPVATPDESPEEHPGFVRISSDGAMRSVITDDQGRYEFDGLLPEYKYSLSISCWKYSHALVRNVRPARIRNGVSSEDSSQNSSDVDITLERGGILRGRVMDAEGRAVSSAKVKAILQPLKRPRASRRSSNDSIFATLPIRLETHSVRTDLDGNYAIFGLRPGTYVLRAKLPNRVPGRVEGIGVVDGGELVGIEIVLRRGESISGRVVDRNGNAVVGAGLRVYNENDTRTITDLQGRFQVRGLSPGNISLKAEKAGFVAIKLVLPAPGSNALVTMARAATIRGAVVRSRSGEPVAGARIQLRQTASVSIRPTRRARTLTISTARSGADGSFLLEGVPEGDYQIVVTQPQLAQPQLAETTVPSISLRAGEVRELLIEMRRTLTAR